MKYFLDTEFIEGIYQCLDCPPRHFIDLISIGLVDENGRAYYAISTDFDPEVAGPWVKENVLPKLPPRDAYTVRAARELLPRNFPIWKSNEQIRRDLLMIFQAREGADGIWGVPEGIELYGYYADYDWVLFCSLFGRMIDLPKGMPMYCRDLKQMFDESLSPEDVHTIGYKAAVKKLQAHPDYPKNENEHDAWADAEWNRKLYFFLLSLSK